MLPFTILRDQRCKHTLDDSKGIWPYIDVDCNHALRQNLNDVSTYAATQFAPRPSNATEQAVGCLVMVQLIV
jgi:hypothetical protein